MLDLVEDEDDWELGEIPMSTDADVCASLPVDLTGIEMRCRELSLAFSDKAENVLSLAFSGLCVLQE